MQGIKPYFKKRNQGPRCNHQIRAKTVRVIDEQGANLGIVDIHMALNLAKNKGLDLILINDRAEPNVCRIMDRGKYLYQQSKNQVAKKQVVVKEIQLSPNISRHDLDIKMVHGLEFLQKGLPVKLYLRLRGREKAHPEIAVAQVNTAITILSAAGNNQTEPRIIGNSIHVMMQPKRT